MLIDERKHPPRLQWETDMDIPLPEPVDDVWVMWRGERELLRAEGNYYTADQMRAYGDARAAAAVERALDAVDECPGLTMEQDRWLSAAIRASAKPAPAHGAAPDTPRTSRTP